MEFSFPAQYLEDFKELVKRLYAIRFEDSGFKGEIGRTMWKGQYLTILRWEEPYPEDFPEEEKRIEFWSHVKKKFNDIESEFFAYLDEIEKEKDDG